MQFVDLGRLDFRPALEIQERAIAQIAAGDRDELVHFVEHPHVFTVGRSGDPENLLADVDFDGNPIRAIRLGRGGDITHHGPGQLVAYPHLDLRLRGRDVHRYLRGLEEVVIGIASSFGIEAFRRPGLTGAWVKKGKLASIGVGVRRWITLHGFALNVENDLRYFHLINPCGIERCPMASLSEILGRRVGLNEVRPVVERELRRVFELVEGGVGSTESKVEG